jgi:hypothetical protein
VSATASDNVGVVGVRFFLDDTSVGTEDTSAPYSASVSGATQATHRLRAQARDAAGNVSNSTEITVTVTVSTPTSAASIEVGRVQFGNDYTTLGDVPSGGTLFSVWAKIPDPGPIPWSRGNMDDYVLSGTNWHVRCLTGNGSADSPTDATLNANSMLFVDPSNTWVDDYSYYFQAGYTDAQLRGWVWAAWQIILNADSFTIRQWLKVGMGAPVIAAGESNPTFAEIRATLVSKRGFTAAQAAAWVPGPATSFRVGSDHGYLAHARMGATSAVPSLTELDTIAKANAADTSAWADYEFNWANGAPNLSDRSGHDRNLSLRPGGTLYQGPAGPAF